MMRRPTVNLENVRPYVPEIILEDMDPVQRSQFLEWLVIDLRAAQLNGDYFDHPTASFIAKTAMELLMLEQKANIGTSKDTLSSDDFVFYADGSIDYVATVVKTGLTRYKIRKVLKEIK